MARRVPDSNTRHQARSQLYARLVSRRSEIEQAALDRIFSIDDPTGVADPEYVEGLRSTVSAALNYAFLALSDTEAQAPPIPVVLLSQARLAARNGVSLDTVLRRYLAGYAVLGDFLHHEDDFEGPSAGIPPGDLLHSHVTLLERLVETISDEYMREVESHPPRGQPRYVKRIEQLLAGEPTSTYGLPIDFDSWHIGLIATGYGSAETIRDLARTLDRYVFEFRRGEDTTWGWLTGKRPLDPLVVQRVAAEDMPEGVCLSLGEPGEGLAGWRLSHQQAAAGLSLALRRGDRVIRYAEDALLASIIQDNLLTTSLWELYLKPLGRGRDKGRVARETLRAYFDARCNVSSSAAALGVSRQAVNSRLRVIEERLNCRIGDCAVDLEMALRVADLDPSLMS